MWYGQKCRRFFFALQQAKANEGHVFNERVDTRSFMLCFNVHMSYKKGIENLILKSRSLLYCVRKLGSDLYISLIFHFELLIHRITLSLLLVQVKIARRHKNKWQHFVSFVRISPFLTTNTSANHVQYKVIIV